MPTSHGQTARDDLGRTSHFVLVLGWNRRCDFSRGSYPCNLICAACMSPREKKKKENRQLGR